MFLFLMQVAAAPAASATGAVVTARVDRLFQEWNNPRSPGCALGIVRDGELVYRHGYGIQNLKTGAPLTTRSVFYAASVSKQFAAASTILAARDGLLSLDDDVRKWIPTLPAEQPTITIRHLLHHVSGIRDYLSMWDAMGALNGIHSDEDLIGLLSRQQRLNFDPGADFSYNNSGYVLLSFIIRKATGKSLQEFARERIFEPLGMRTSAFHDDRTAQQNPKTFAIGYNPTKAGGLEPGLLTNFDKVGDGGLYTTVEDLARWDQNFYSQKVGGDGFTTQLTTRGILANGDTINYAGALVVDEYKGLRTVEHSGTFMGYRNDLLRFPDQRFSVILLCNRGTIDPTVLARQIADLYLADVLRKQVERFVGEYASDELRVTFRVVARDGNLFLIRPGAGESALTPVQPEYGARVKQHADQFTYAASLEPMKATFASDGGAQVTALLIEAPRARAMRFVRR
ncbi:MAG: serine hydrolase domain-containing protein [Gemmatimonadota bacterium]